MGIHAMVSIQVEINRLSCFLLVWVSMSVVLWFILLECVLQPFIEVYRFSRFKPLRF